MKKRGHQVCLIFGIAALLVAAVLGAKTSGQTAGMVRAQTISTVG